MADFDYTQDASGKGSLGIIIGAVVLALVLLYIIFAAGTGTPTDPANFVDPNAAVEPAAAPAVATD